VLNTAGSCVLETCRLTKKPPGLAAVRTSAAILQIERDPPTASELSKLKYQKLLAAMMIMAAL
jgi:hypothetical protein